MEHATNISLPSLARVREILREVQDVTVDGAVFTQRGKHGFEALSADTVRNGMAMPSGVTVVNAGNWLLHRLLHEYQPSSAPQRTKQLQAVGIFSNFTSTHYNIPGRCHTLEPHLIARTVEHFAHGDATLEAELEQVLSTPTERCAMQLKSDYGVVDTKSSGSAPTKINARQHRLIPRYRYSDAVKDLRCDYAAALKDSMQHLGISAQTLADHITHNGLVISHSQISNLKYALSYPSEAQVQSINEALIGLHRMHYPNEALPESFAHIQQIGPQLAEQAVRERV